MIRDINYFNTDTKEWVGFVNPTTNATLNLLKLNKNQLSLAPEGSDTFKYMQDNIEFSLTSYNLYLMDYYSSLGYLINNIILTIKDTTLNVDIEVLDNAI